MDGALYGVSGSVIFSGLLWMGIKAYFRKQKEDSDKLQALKETNAVNDTAQGRDIAHNKELILLVRGEVKTLEERFYKIENK